MRFPLGGYLSWVLQWLVGFERLGHEVYFVEKAGWPLSCYHPVLNERTNDCTYGVSLLVEHLQRFGLEDRWCYVDNDDVYHGLQRDAIERVFATAELFVDMGTHGTWLAEAAKTGTRIYVDGDPGYTQMLALVRNEDLGEYDHYYTVGRDVGTDRSTVPTMGLTWRPVFDPVVTDLFPDRPVPEGAAFSTVMAWRSYPPVYFEGVEYGAKNHEFDKFFDLPTRTTAKLELATSGARVPAEKLLGGGWHLQNPLEVTKTAWTFWDYIAASRGEFTVSKNFYVATNSGFFSEKSAVYLASGRPVVMQETGFSRHLPCGRGLFAVRNAEEAAAAIDAVSSDFDLHSRAAREIAREHLDTGIVLRDLLRGLGIA